VTIRVLLADDQELLRMGFRMILTQEPGIEVVGEAGNGEEAIALASSCDPHVVLMDVRMPVVDGIEATRQIVSDNPAVRVLVLTTFDLDAYAFGALRAGASGFLLKDVPPAELVAGIRAVASGDAVVSPRITRRLLDEFAPLLEPPGHRELAQGASAMAKLTDREQEVLVAVDGLPPGPAVIRTFVPDALLRHGVERAWLLLGCVGLLLLVLSVAVADQLARSMIRPLRRLPFALLWAGLATAATLARFRTCGHC